MTKTDKTIQGSTVTEYVIRDGKQGVFSHADKSVSAAKLAALKVADHANGTHRPNLKLHKRTVHFPDHDTVPVGADSVNVNSTVLEDAEVLDA